MKPSEDIPKEAKSVITQNESQILEKDKISKTIKEAVEY
jgi:hypothetical protein